LVLGVEEKMSPQEAGDTSCGGDGLNDSGIQVDVMGSKVVLK